MVVGNTLAYYDMVKITTIKSFIVETADVNIKKPFFPLSKLSLFSFQRNKICTEMLNGQVNYR
jgi:hypothetical protein